MIHRIRILNWRPWPDNKLSGGTHWAVRRKRKAHDAQVVSIYAWEAGTPHALGPRRVQLEIVLTGRQKQVDPLAYAKSLLDALVKCRLLIDDSPGLVEWVAPTYTRGELASTTIVLTDLED